MIYRKGVTFGIHRNMVGIRGWSKHNVTLIGTRTILVYEESEVPRIICALAFHDVFFLLAYESVILVQLQLSHKAKGDSVDPGKAAKNLFER
jgi:hypothetical protein